MVKVTENYKVIISAYNINAYLFRTPTFRKDLLHILTLLKESWTLFIECYGAVETVEHFTPVHANYQAPHGGNLTRLRNYSLPVVVVLRFVIFFSICVAGRNPLRRSTNRKATVSGVHPAEAPSFTVKCTIVAVSVGQVVDRIICTRVR